MATTISTAVYADAMRVLKQATDALDPRELALPLENNFSSIEGDRARVVKAVADLQNTVSTAYANALQAQANGV